MNARLVLAALTASLVALAGCETTPGTTQSQYGNPSFNVVNRSATTIRYIYVIPVGATTWGKDWLANTVLHAGQQFRVALPRDGRCMFHVRVVYSNEQAEERHNQNLCSLSEIAFSGPRAATASNADFDVVNRSSQTIQEVYVAPSPAHQWGTDRLPGTIAPGARYKVVMPRDGRCQYDVRVVYQDRTSEERRSQNLCGLSELAFAGAPRPAAAASNPDFAVVNKSSLTIRELYVSSAKSDKWGQDRLPGTLAPGARFEVKLPRDGQCQFDVRVVYTDRSTEDRRGQNVCTISELFFTGTGRVAAARPARRRDSPADQALDRHWVRYLREIQADRAYSNWSGPPYDLYVKSRPQ
jgi:hypothetical protein